MKEKVVRDGMIDITTGKRLGKKKVVMEKEEEKPKTLWHGLVEYTNRR